MFKKKNYIYISVHISLTAMFKIVFLFFSKQSSFWNLRMEYLIFYGYLL